MSVAEHLQGHIAGTELSFNDFSGMVLADYRLACLSREASLLGRKEVLTGKAKFGIFGDGKEIPQLAMARVFRPGDFRSGYYRDQTFALAAGMCTVQQLFAQLYADTDPAHEPMSGGRQMNAHFATRSIDEQGRWLPLSGIKNSTADSSPTASQMPRSLGIALASRFFRELPGLSGFPELSDQGNEVSFVTIGDASTSEGHFWETLNAAGVMQVPLVISVWDDGYGISVPIAFQTTKGSISEITRGFMTDENGNGVDIYVVNGWDYPALIETYQVAVEKTRTTHIPCLIHVKEVTQPQGHSTSGSHERYKSKERLEWEKENDGIRRMREWILQSAITDEAALQAIEQEARESARQQQKQAWTDYTTPIREELSHLVSVLQNSIEEGDAPEVLQPLSEQLSALREPFRRDLLESARAALYALRGKQTAAKDTLVAWIRNYELANAERYNTHLLAEHEGSALQVRPEPAVYADDAPLLNGFEILNACFDAALDRDLRVMAFGEDLGKIGDVNQGFAGLQEKYGPLRVADTGIREATIMGQGIGLAMRGLRPIAEIQYLDYLLYGLQPLSDDLATLHYRTNGIQKAPLIVRTRGHRLEGIWHTGSPIGMILHALRGMHVLVPRNMTQAAGFYNTLLQSDDPALVIECLNGYRLKEKLPSNIGSFCLALGIPEILREGEDVTLVSYGSTLRVIEEAMKRLDESGIHAELLDVQTLLPFDTAGVILESVKKTNRVVFIDEDVPGGATAYMMQQVLEVQGAYQYLDSAPLTISAKAHRSAYASDADYFCKPNAEEIFEKVYGMMRENNPQRFPALF